MYLALGVLIAVAGVRKSASTLSGSIPTLNMTHLDLANHEANRVRASLAPRSTKIRRVAALAVMTLITPVVWLALFKRTSELARLRPGDVSARLRLQPGEVSMSTCCVAIAAAALLARWQTGDRWYVTAMAILVIGANIGRQALASISSDLTSTLKRGAGDPYRVFIRIAAGDLIALSVASIILIRWTPNTSFRWAWLYQEPISILSLGHLESLRHLATPVVPNALTAIAAITLYTQTISQITKYKQFDRNLRDRLDVGMSILATGNSMAALSWALPIDDFLNEGLAIYTIRGCVSLDQKDFDGALYFANVYAHLLDTPDDQQSALDDAFTYILTWQIVNGINAEIFTQLLTLARIRSVSDGCLTTQVLRVRSQRLLGEADSVDWTSILDAAKLTAPRFSLTRLITLVDQPDKSMTYVNRVEDSGTLWTDQLEAKLLRTELNANAFNELGHKTGRRHNSPMIHDLRDLIAYINMHPIKTMPLWLRQNASEHLAQHEELLIEDEHGLWSEIFDLRLALVGDRALSDSAFLRKLYSTQ
jgi:hypothetical protein